MFTLFCFSLKGFVKIAKWNDSNFWAMKQAADKSHYTLHKFVRKYEVTVKGFFQLHFTSY